MALNRDEIRQRIDALECMSDIAQSMGDIKDVEWEAGESQLFDIQITTREDSRAVTFVHGLLPSVLLAGLLAMEQELAKLADVRETVDLP